MNKSKKVFLHYLVSVDSLKRRTELKRFIINLFKREGKNVLEIHYIFCTDLYLSKLNKDWLGKSDFTDVISFDLSEGDVLIGEIYISVERIAENCRVYNICYLHELYRVMFHGALHLCGYKDKAQPEESTMRRKEDYYLQQYLDVPRGTINRLIRK